MEQVIKEQIEAGVIRSLLRRAKYNYNAPLSRYIIYDLHDQKLLKKNSVIISQFQLLLDDLVAQKKILVFKDSIGRRRYTLDIANSSRLTRN